MKTRATGKYLRIGPRKVRVLSNLIRRKKPEEALQILDNLTHKGAILLQKVLKSAVANARQRKMRLDNLIVSEVLADGGPSFKRMRPRSMGRADVILKRTTHISIELSDDSVPLKEERTARR